MVATINRLLLLLSIISSSSLVSSTSNKQSEFCSSEQHLPGSYQNQMATTLGGLHNPSESNSTEIDSLARFAVQEHNKNQNEMLEFVRVVKAQEQVVAGTLHHLTLEAVHEGKNKLYEAKVWVKPWMNFKELQEFKHTGEATTSDIGVGKDGDLPGWQLLAVNDPLVQDAAVYVVKTLQQRSNSLYPYKLQEVVHAKKQVVEEVSKLEMVVKVQRGEKEEKLNVEVHKDNGGVFHLNKMVQDHS